MCECHYFTPKCNCIKFHYTQSELYGSIALSWATSSSASWYYIYRNTSLISTVTGLTFISNITSNSYTDNVSALGTYYYVIIAANQFGNSSISNCVSVAILTPLAPVINPILPNSTNSGSVSLSWTISLGASSYYIYRDIKPITSVIGLTYLVNTSATNYTDIITNIGIYYYAIITYSQFGNSSLSSCVNVTVAGNDWAMFHEDSTHDGVGVTGLGGNYTLSWSYTTGNSFESSPAIVGNYLYIGNLDGGIYCLNVTSGKLIWKYTTGNSIYLSLPAIAGGFVYVGSYDDNLYCLNAYNGSLVWKYATGSSIDSSPAVAGGCVYIGSEDHNLYCINATSGIMIWKYTTNALIYVSSPAIVGGFVYTGSYDHYIYCLNATTGSLVWNYQTGSTIDSSPAVANGYIYVGCYDNKLYCLNATTGSSVWKYSTGSSIVSSPAVAGKYVYIGSQDDHLYCLNAATGGFIWS